MYTEHRLAGELKDRWDPSTRNLNMGLAKLRTPRPHTTIKYLERNFAELFVLGLAGSALMVSRTRATAAEGARTTWISYEALAEVYQYIDLGRAASAEGITWRPPSKLGEPLVLKEPDWEGAFLPRSAQRPDEEAKTLHVGPVNFCWFRDPSKALCLRLSGTPNATKPLVGMRVVAEIDAAQTVSFGED